MLLAKEHMIDLCAFKYLSLFDHAQLDSEISSLLRFHNDKTAEIHNLCSLYTYKTL